MTSVKLSFGQKLGLVISSLAVGVATVVSVLFYVNIKTILIRGMGDRLLDIGRTASYLVQDQEIDAIRRVKEAIQEDLAPAQLVMPLLSPGDYRPAVAEDLQVKTEKSPEFLRLIHLLKRIKAAAPEHSLPEPERLGDANAVAEKSTIAYATLLVPTPISPDMEALQFVADADYDHPEFPNPVGSIYKINSGGITHALTTYQAAADDNFDMEEGQYLLSAGIPLFDREGKFLAILALDYNAESEANQINTLFLVSISIVAAALVISIGVSILMARVLHRPISILRRGAEQVAQRSFDVEIPLKSNDELGLLAQAFNTMVAEIGAYAQGLERLNRSYSRFVPKEFLEHLGRESINEVKLGDQIQKRMTVLFSDIRSFTSISESMSPRDNIDFINDYLKMVSPIIREHSGFIDKYIGDAIMALFPETPDGAVAAAVGMQRLLDRFNEEGRDLGRPKVSIGVGLHMGILMLGTVGEPERMDGTVISDAVNLTSRLEGLTKEYGASIIVTERLVEALADPKKFQLRKLGKVRVKGKAKEVRIIEVIDGDSPDQQRRKIITREDFELGLRSIEKGNYTRALRLLKRVLKVNKHDVAAQHFMKYCRWQIAREKQKIEGEGRVARKALTPYPTELHQDRKKG